MAEVLLLPVVAGALIDGEGRVLLQQRPLGKSMEGMWELPGGKVESFEGPEAALARELEEELGIAVAMEDVEPLTFTTAGLGDRHLLLLLYRVLRWTGEPRALEATALRWERPRDMYALPMPPADVPLVAALAALLDEPACGD